MFYKKISKWLSTVLKPWYKSDKNLKLIFKDDKYYKELQDVFNRIYTSKPLFGFCESIVFNGHSIEEDNIRSDHYNVYKGDIKLFSLFLIKHISGNHVFKIIFFTDEKRSLRNFLL